MSSRLAGELTLLSVAAVSLRAVWDNWSLQGAIESAFWVGVVAWAAGYIAGEILRKLATEYVSTEVAGGTTPSTSKAETPPPQPDTP